MYFLALSHAPPPVPMSKAKINPVVTEPSNIPPTKSAMLPLGSQGAAQAAATGGRIGKMPGAIIPEIAVRVSMATAWA